MVAALFLLASKIVHAAAPDLVVTDVAVLGQAVSGQPVPVSWTVSNQGNGPADGSWLDVLCLCSNTTINSTITYWYWNESGPMAAGTSYTNTSGSGLDLPWLQPGTYYWIAVTDYGHSVTGDNYNNNTNTPVAFQVTAPDLVVSNFTMYGQAVPGQAVSLSWTVLNQGNGPVESDICWDDYLFLCTNTTLNSAIKYWYWGNCGPLASGASYVNTNGPDAVVLPTLQPGTYYWIAVTDYGLSVPGDNYNNNTSAPVAIAVLGPPEIVAQPTNETVNPGMNATFSVGVSSPLPVTFQWQKNGTNLIDGGNISGSATSSLTVSDVSISDVASYSVIVTTTAGSGASESALLTINGSATLTFEGLENDEPVDDYYNGGFGGSGTGPGPNYGVIFTTNSLALISKEYGGTGNFSNNPSGDTTLYFLTGSGDIMNVPGGFTGGFWFYYSAAFDPGMVTVWSGLNGTGTEIASVNLPVTPKLPGPYDYDNWVFAGTTFSGTAYSVVFGGTTNQIGFDDIILGSYSPVTGSTLANVRAVQQPGTNLVDVTYDLGGVSTPVYVSILVSTNGGQSYNVQPSSLSGEGAITPVASGLGYELFWNAGVDLPNFQSSLMRVELWVTGGGSFAQAVSPIFSLNTFPVATGGVTGTVLTTTGLPITNAQVRIDGDPFFTNTSSGGTFALFDIPVGNGYVLDVSAAGYAPKRLISVNVPVGSTNLGNITLTNISGPMSLIPLVPDVNPAITTVEQGGTAYRYYQLVSSTKNGTPLVNIPVTVEIQGGSAIIQTNDVSSYWPGLVAGISDPDGIVRVSIPASALNSSGTIQTVQLSVSNQFQQSFQAQVVPRQYDQVWKQTLGGGVSIGELLTAGVGTSAESDLDHAIVGGTLSGETISRIRKANIQAGVGINVGSSLFAQLEAGAGISVGTTLNTEFSFDPNTTDPEQNALKLYVDLGNVLSGIPGPAQGFYDFVDSTIAPAFYQQNLSSVESDMQAGVYSDGTAQLGIGYGKPAKIGVGFQGGFSADADIISGYAENFGNVSESAVISGVEASASADVSVFAGIEGPKQPDDSRNSAAVSYSVLDWGLGAQQLVKTWTRQGQGNPYRVEQINEVSMQQRYVNPSLVWQRYDPQTLYANYARDFTETIEETNGSSIINYAWSVYANNVEFQGAIGFDIVIGVNFQGELDQGVNAVNERGAISRSRYWPMESYPAIASDMFPTQSWTSIISQWGGYAASPIGQAINSAVTDVQNGVNTVVQAGQATLNVAKGALNSGAQVLSSWASGLSNISLAIPAGKPLPLGGPVGNGVAYLPPDGSSNYVYGIGGVYRFSSTNTLNGSANLTICYSNADITGLDPTQFQIYQLPDGTNRWQLVGGTVNTNTETVTATISSLGTFAIAPPLPTGNLQLILSTNALPADGKTEMTVTITNLTLNNAAAATQPWLFTATANGVQILNPNSDTNLPGIQIISTNGVVTLLLQAPVGGTVANVSLASVAGDAYGSAEINIIDTTPPATPANVTVTAGQSRIWVSWTANAEPDLAGYRVYYHAGAAGPPWNGTAEIDGSPSPIWVTGTNCLLQGLSLGTNYFITVSAVDTTGNESPLSPAQEVTTIPVAPMPPTDVAASFGSNGTNVLMWALSQDDGYNDRDVVQYYIWRVILPGGNYVNIGQVAAGIGVFVTTNPVVATTQSVSYAVSAVAASGLASTQAVATVVATSSVVSSNVVIGSSRLLSNGSFQLTINGGVSGQNYVLLASTNLVNWIPISGFMDTNPPITIYDPDAWEFRYRFYRIGPLSLAPAMQLGLNSGQGNGSNGFHVVLYSLPGLNYQIEASTNLFDWVTITNFVSTNSSFYFSDPQAKNYKQRFYRAVMP